MVDFIRNEEGGLIFSGFPGKVDWRESLKLEKSSSNQLSRNSASDSVDGVETLGPDG